MLAGAVVTEAGGSASKMAHIHGWQAGGRPQPMYFPLQGHLSILLTWHLLFSEQGIQKSKTDPKEPFMIQPKSHPPSFQLDSTGMEDPL